MSYPTPSDLGLPEKFASWRPNQLEAVLEINNAERPYVTQVVPTGGGKSLQYVSAAHLSGSRCVILTSTKGLQTQLLNDFHSIGLVDIRGKNAYPCRLENDGSTCDQGPCIAGYDCMYRKHGCKYFNALRLAQNADIVSTNYSFWMYSNKYSKGIGKFNLMVCDEAHDLPNLISDFLTVSLSTNSVYVSALLPRDYQHATHKEWASWAHDVEPQVDADILVLKQAVLGGGSKQERRELARALAFKNTVGVLLRINNNWIIDQSEKNKIAFAPIWPRGYGKKVLFFDIPTILLTSATVCKKTLDMVGIESDETVYTEYPHSFPIKNRRLIHIPTVRMNRFTNASGMKTWLGRIDQIIRPRLDRKGLIHTVSYARKNEIINYSEFRDHMLTHTTKTAINTVMSFKMADPPAILVSPSMTTGWDFPDDEARFQIIGKIAYPDTRNKIVKARCDEDKEYAGYVAMQQLIQACGRPVRHSEDWAETFIIDDNIGWFLKYNNKFAPDWFNGAFGTMKMLPKPPKMGGE